MTAATDADPMGPQAFRDLLDRHGAAPAAWPAARRAAALALVERDPAARADWQRAQRLDRALATVLAAEPGDGDAALLARIKAAVPQAPAAGDNVVPLVRKRPAPQAGFMPRYWAASAAAVLLAAFLGFKLQPVLDGGTADSTAALETAEFTVVADALEEISWN